MMTGDDAGALLIVNVIVIEILPLPGLENLTKFVNVPVTVGVPYIWPKTYWLLLVQNALKFNPVGMVAVTICLLVIGDTVVP